MVANAGIHRLPFKPCTKQACWTSSRHCPRVCGRTWNVHKFCPRKFPNHRPPTNMRVPPIVSSFIVTFHKAGGRFLHRLTDGLFRVSRPPMSCEERRSILALSNLMNALRLYGRRIERSFVFDAIKVCHGRNCRRELEADR